MVWLKNRKANILIDIAVSFTFRGNDHFCITILILTVKIYNLVTFVGVLHDNAVLLHIFPLSKNYSFCHFNIQLGHIMILIIFQLIMLYSCTSYSADCVTIKNMSLKLTHVKKQS